MARQQATPKTPARAAKAMRTTTTPDANEGTEATAAPFDREQAIREAGEVRFLPIILTTLTAIGGLIPIAISTNPLISPLAIVMIGGLISSTLLSRIVTPVVYKLIPPAI